MPVNDCIEPRHRAHQSRPVLSLREDIQRIAVVADDVVRHFSFFLRNSVVIRRLSLNGLIFFLSLNADGSQKTVELFALSATGYFS